MDAAGAVYEYLVAVFAKWYSLVTVILFGIDKALEWMWPRYRAWLNDTFPFEKRRRFFWGALLFFVFLSGFFAWRDEHLALEKTRRDLAQAARASQPLETEITKRVNRIVEERLRPRELTDEQKKKLADVLNVVPLGETYSLVIDSTPDCSKCWIFADDLFAEWRKTPRWGVQRNGMIAVDRRLAGIRFGFRSDCPPKEIEVVKEALGVVGLRPNASLYTDKEKDLGKGFLPACQISVGSEPWE
jgi:hypothetical protein